MLFRSDPQVGDAIRARSLDSTSVGVRAQADLRDAADDEGYVEPHLWTGIGRARSGCGAAIVGSPAQVAATIEGYRDLGIDTFILSGYPHLEEAYRVAELLFPLLPLQHARPAGQANLTGPFGEVIANDIVPPAPRAKREGAPA